MWKVSHLGNKNEWDHSEWGARVHSLSYWFSIQVVECKGFFHACPMAEMLENVIESFETVWMWLWRGDCRNSGVLLSLSGLSAISSRAGDLETVGCPGEGQLCVLWNLVPRTRGSLWSPHHKILLAVGSPAPAQMHEEAGVLVPESWAVRLTFCS